MQAKNMILAAKNGIADIIDNFRLGLIDCRIQEAVEKEGFGHEPASLKKKRFRVVSRIRDRQVRHEKEVET